MPRLPLVAGVLVLGTSFGPGACGGESEQAENTCKNGALELEGSGDGCEVCRCEEDEWICEDFACVEPECPMLTPVPPTPECPARANWARDPETGGCCLYDNLCLDPEGWLTFASAQSACESQESLHCEPGDRVPAGDGCNECFCNETGDLWDCSDYPCSSSTPPPGDACGFFEGGCPPDQYCAFNPPQACSHFDAPSVCRVIPEECTDEEGTVCGCNSVTYGNRCLAAQAGVGIFDVGACEPVRPPPGECGHDLGTCLADEYCAFFDSTGFEGTGCGADGAPGGCRIRPEACVEQFNPVCGCDGVSYPNACFAAMAGTSVLKPGECS